MKVTFDEKTHIYAVNGDIASISVTELLAKHKLAPDYSGIDKQTLKESATRGKEVHKDLENILNTANYVPTTQQGEQFQEWVKKNLECGVGEQLLGYENNGLIIAGTADIMAISKSGELIVADHKNTSTFHREYVEWQVSIYDYFARQLGKNKINGKQLKWVGATKFYCFHYDPKSCEMEVKELNKVPDEEIQKLLICESKGEIYQRPQLIVAPELFAKVKELETTLAVITKQQKQAEENAKAVREEICALMEKQNIKSWKVGDIEMTYVYEQCRVNVDSEKLKRNYPMVFSECQKMTIVKPFVKVKIKEKEDV